MSDELGERISMAPADQDLRAGLAGLSHLATSEMEVAGVLTRVADFAVLAIAGADGAELTLIEAGRPDRVVMSTAFSPDVSATEYGIADAPHPASAQARMLTSGELETDLHVPHRGSQTATSAAHSALSMPLKTPLGLLGTITVYARVRNAFDERTSRLGQRFAEPAAIAVEHARTMAETKRLATQLREALTEQAAIDRATGILMARSVCSPDEARDQMRRDCQTRDETMYTVALRIVEDAAQSQREPTRPQPIPSTSSPSANLTVRLVYRDEARALVIVHGELTAGTTHTLATVLMRNLHAGHRYLHLDVSKLSSCDRDGAKTLIDAHRAFIAAGGALVLVGAQTTLRRHLHRARVDTVLFLARERHQRPDRWTRPS